MSAEKKPPAPSPMPWEELQRRDAEGHPLFQETPPERAPATWQGMLGTAILVGAVGVGVIFLARLCEQQASAPGRRRPRARRAVPDMNNSTDPALTDAAHVLGVAVDASPDEIRAAFRRRFADERLHPDQGGDEEAAKRLTAAKNLLIQQRRRGAR